MSEFTAGDGNIGNSALVAAGVNVVTRNAAPIGVQLSIRPITAWDILYFQYKRFIRPRIIICSCLVALTMNLSKLLQTLAFLRLPPFR